MTDNYGLIQPGPDAPAHEWTAYRRDWSDRAMQEHHARLRKLQAELCAKVRHADGERALAAFNKVLAVARVEPWDAASAQFKLESWDDAGFAENGSLSAEEGRAAQAWREAIEAGRVELCDRPPFVSEEAFGLVGFLGRDPLETFEQVFPLTQRIT